MKEPCSFEVHGTGTPPEGKAFTVANQETNERYYFEGRVKSEQGKWSAALRVGSAETKAGTRIHLSAVLMDAKWRDYLAGVTDEPDATYWSSTGLPPSGTVVAKAEVETKQQCKD